MDQLVNDSRVICSVVMVTDLWYLRQKCIKDLSYIGCSDS
jgi:hypothetical protein